MSSQNGDAVLSWSLAEIGTLDLNAYEAGAPVPAESSYSVTLWYTAVDDQRRQVIINQGDDEATSAGWSLALEGGFLIFRVACDDGRSSETRLPHPPEGDWHFAAAVIDRTAGAIRLHSRDHTTSAPLPDAPITPGSQVRIGGYTDPAGGHYNYTFGRQGSGLVDDCRIYQHALTPDDFAALLPAPAQVPTIHIRVQGDDVAPTTLHFEALADAPERVRACLWDFGDGTRDTGAQVAHRYAYAGDYTVRLTIVDAAFTQARATHTLRLSGAPNPLAVSPVFINGEGGCACYRIPSVVRTTSGTLLAFAEGRVERCSDSTRTVVGAMARSDDDGRTWNAPQIAFRNIWQGEEYAVQNISPVVDTVYGTGRIIVVYNALEHSEWDLARGRGISRVYCIASDDDGQTWHTPQDITPAVHRPYNPAYAETYPDAAHPENKAHDWRLQRPTLGHGIQLQRGRWRGRIVHAGVFSAGDRSVFQSQNYIFYSDDLGQSWDIAGILPQSGLNEATLAERDDGRILINSRAYLTDDRSAGRRALTLAHFDDAGVLHIEATRYDDALIDPAVQASMVACPHPEDTAHSVLLFSNPAHPHARVNLTLRASLDGGQTWPISRLIDPGPSAYSDMACGPDGRVTLVYERGNEGGIACVNVALAWLLAAQ